MSGSIIDGGGGTESSEGATDADDRLVGVVPPAADAWDPDPTKASATRDEDFAGGIARLGLGSADGRTDFAGGILRFNLGGRGPSRPGGAMPTGSPRSRSRPASAPRLDRRRDRLRALPAPSPAVAALADEPELDVAGRLLE